MRRRGLNAVVRAIREMSWVQRRELLPQLEAAGTAQDTDSVVADGMRTLRMCPHCKEMHIVRQGQAHGLRRYRYRYRGCGKTFNALTGTPLARLRRRGRWLEQTQALIDGQSITKAAGKLQVARSTAFHWRRRLLALPQHVKAARVKGTVEADENCMLKSFKDQCSARLADGLAPRARRGRATKRAMSSEQDVVLVALVVRDRSGACTNQIVQKPDTAHLAAVLRPVLAGDAVLYTGGSRALAAATRFIGVEHHAINVSAGQHRVGPWHINNVNGYPAAD